MWNWRPIFIDDLLDLTRVANGKIQLHRKLVDAHELLREAMTVVRADASVAQPPIALELEATRHYIQVDPARIQQVLWNLIRNAVKFTPHEGQVTIRTSDSEDGRIRIDVTDTGRGIAPAALPGIFDAFEQGDLEIGHQFGGLGLGLTISKALVEMHQGTLRAASKGLETGATFTLELDAQGGGQLDADSQQSRRQVHGNRERILLVEDHENTAALMLRLLRKRGFDVVLAMTKAEAIAHRE